MKDLLSLISKPVRYLGKEIHSIRKDPSQVRLRFCLAFPDVYEVGMSHLGIQILYHILNAMEGVACERVFAPWADMERVLREKNVPLSSLESSTPLSEFDMVGFSLQYELCYTNVLNMLELSKIPFFAQDRDETFPLIIAGGPSAFNPAPVADFFDAIVIGDGEEVVVEICDLVVRARKADGKKEDMLKALSQLEGVYVPLVHAEGKPIRKRTVSDLNKVPYPTCPVVPFMKVVHDRLSMEIARGCKRGCRFCEAGFIHRPYRERSPKAVQEMLKASLKQTGYDEFSLLSLSAGDYSSIAPLLSTLMDYYEPQKVAVSFPSLRIESVVGYLAEQVKRVRKTGFTIAPEAGTERLRRVINKELDEEVILSGSTDLFAKGWRNIKLYFMMGLPTEEEEDLRGIMDLSRRLSALGQRKKTSSNISVSVSTFVPKPHTPFQWEPQIPLQEMKERLQLLRQESKRHRLHFKWQDPHLSHLEGIFSAGGRDLARVLVEAHRLGCRFDGWTEQFLYPSWKVAFEKAGVTMDRPAKKKQFESILPWSFIETGIKPEFLWEEYQRGLKEEVSPPCRGEPCVRCGVCNGKEIRVVESREETGLLESVRPSSTPKTRAEKKVRLTFTKEGEMRFISHLELAHLFYRASKRASLPLCYSEGFHPMPRIIFATALPVGVESLGEIVDMELVGRMTPTEVQERLNEKMAQGIRIVEAKEVALDSSPSSVKPRSVYWIKLHPLILRREAVDKLVSALAKEELILQQKRKGKERRVDIRPFIEKMEIKRYPLGDEMIPEGEEREKGENNLWGVELILQSSGGRTAKPTEILGAVLDLEEEMLSQCKVIKIE